MFKVISIIIILYIVFLALFKAAGKERKLRDKDDE